MPKKLGPGRCSYCLADVDELTEDHVFPRSWYTANTPANVPKPKAPACRRCNNERYSAIESELRGKFALSYALGDERVAGVQEPALRAIDPNSTTDEAERSHRELRRRRVYREIAEMAALPEPPPGIGLVPGFGPDEPNAETRLPVPIKAADLHDMAEKIVRGMAFVQTGRLIEPPYEVYTTLLNEASSDVFMREMVGAREVSFGSAFEFTAARVPEDPVVGAFHIRIWGQLRICASVTVGGQQ